MSGVKEDVIALIKKLPDDVSMDENIAELYFKMKVDKGLEDRKTKCGRGNNPSLMFIESVENILSHKGHSCSLDYIYFSTALSRRKVWRGYCDLMG